MGECLGEIEKKGFTMIEMGRDEATTADGSSMRVREGRIKAINGAWMEMCRTGDVVDVGLE